VSGEIKYSAVIGECRNSVTYTNRVERHTSDLPAKVEAAECRLTLGMLCRQRIPQTGMPKFEPHALDRKELTLILRSRPKVASGQRAILESRSKKSQRWSPIGLVGTTEPVPAHI
jgi:hypothetical protein